MRATFFHFLTVSAGMCYRNLLLMDFLCGRSWGFKRERVEDNRLDFCSSLEVCRALTELCLFLVVSVEVPDFSCSLHGGGSSYRLSN